MFGLDLELWQMGVLFGAGYFAALVDSIAGGGGLISVPAMLLAGIPGLTTLSTNKYQATIGKVGVISKLVSAGWGQNLSKSFVLSTATGAFFFSSLGAFALIQSASKLNIKWFLVFLQFGILLWLLRLWFLGSDKSTTYKKPFEYSAAPFLRKAAYRFWNGLLGFYDGFFGPGTGNFLLILYEKLGFSTPQSIALTKVANLSSNLGGTVVFLLMGKGHLGYALLMAAGACLGGYSGALVMTRITTLAIRKLVLIAGSIMLTIQVYGLI